MEDIYQEISATENIISGEATFTLTDDDYEALDLSFGNFSSIEDAKTMLPSFLVGKFPAWGAQSLAAVTFNLYSPIKFEAYTVTAADYAALGFTSLNNSYDIKDFFGYKFPSEQRGTVIDLTYQKEPTIIEYTLTDADYDLVGNGRYNNFDVRPGRADEDEEVRRAKIQTILLNNFPAVALETKYNVTYEVFNGSNIDLMILLRREQNELDASITTDYTLTADDFALVGNGTFNNFDIREGKDEETIEARRAKIETILLNKYPDTPLGNYYNVTYAIYNGAPGTLKMLVEYTGGGGYLIFSGTTYEIYEFAVEENTARFTLTNDWAAPITFTKDEYSLMGQRYPNFSDKDEAIYKIGIYLRTLYQFAEPGDFIAVQYDIFRGGVTVENVNYVFDGSVWNAIPSVIEETIKFGHDGISWVPDNTIKYTLTAADYTLVGNGNYQNFDVREGKAEAEESVRLEKVNIILLNNFPEDAEGQKYIVQFNIYNGAAGEDSLAVVKTGEVYVLQ